MSNRSSINGKYLCRIFSPQGNKKGDIRAARYDDMILHKQRKAAIRKRKQERQNKRKARR